MKTIQFIFIFCFAHFVNAQENSLLWEISGNGLSKPSYLYGTIHVICPKDYFLTDATKNSFKKAEQVYLELDMDDPEMMNKMTRNMMLTNGKKIEDYLKSEDYTLLNGYFKQKMGMNSDQIGAMKPFTLMSMLYITLLNCQPQSYEAVFTQMAANAKKELLGLESVEFQMGVFDKIPYEKQAELLIKMIRKKDESSKELNDMVALYKKQDLEGLLKLIDDSEWDFNGYEDILLANRNTAWIPIMESAMKAKSTFFAVGSAHLGGAEGILQLLKKKGYIVKAVI